MSELWPFVEARKIIERIEKIPKEEIECDNVLRFNVYITEEELFYLKIKYSDQFNMTLT